MSTKAKAPRPRDESVFAVVDGEAVPAAPPSSQAIRMKFKGKPFELALSDIGPGDDEVARRQAKRTLSGAMMAAEASGLIDLSDLYLFVWFSRRKNGEPGLTYQQMLAEFPTYADFLDPVKGLEAESVVLDDGEPDPEG